MFTDVQFLSRQKTANASQTKCASLCTDCIPRAGYRVINIDPEKWRVVPAAALCWGSYQELCQETREENPGLARTDLSQLADERWQLDETTERLHGPCCVDITVVIGQLWRSH